MTEQHCYGTLPGEARCLQCFVHDQESPTFSLYYPEVFCTCPEPKHLCNLEGMGNSPAQVRLLAMTAAMQRAITGLAGVLL